MKRHGVIGSLIGCAVGLAGVLLGAQGAGAEPVRQSQLLIPWGMSFNVGGGVMDFSSKGARNSTDPGALWEARLGLGTRSPIGFEAAYVGAAQNISAIGLDRDAMLVGSGLEGNLRINILPDGAWQPYALVGAGWRHYSLSNVDTNTSDVADTDDVFEVPMGAGVSYRYERLLVDARGTFRTATDSDLFRGRDLDNWSAKLGVGMEF